MNNQKPSNKTFTLQSKLLGREIPYAVIFPANYQESNAKFPVLYLLHGLFGRFDNWLTNTKIIEYAADFPAVIVCAEGGDNWYTDGKHFYESYFFDELFPAVENSFNIRKAKESRAIAGLSMGGYGAFKFAFRRPEMFCLAASMSGAFHAAEIYGDDVWKELQTSILEVFSGDEKIRTRDDLFQIVENFPAEQISTLPFFYFDCGTEDEFLPVNIALAEVFRRRGIPHKFQTLPGRHDWGYWDCQIKQFLQFAAGILT
ncbi:MAG: alpha/beta hydrolase [Pyrinomonadaceae bacterium]